jgi:protein-S-isoprenylcysteine O-methyltransferase Ste14
MLSLGVLLVILGVGSFVLPMIGYQFRLMEPIEPYQPWAGIIVAAVGLITVIFAARGRRAPQATVVEQPPSTPPSTPPEEPAE